MMRIDATTLADLEILHATGGGPGIFHLVDRTRTRAGREALRRRLTRPATTLHEVRARQDAVRFFAERSPGFAVDNDAVEAVEHYLESNLVTTSRSWSDLIESLHLRLGYRDVWREIREGVNRTRALFAILAERCETIERRGAPELVRDLTARIRHASEVVGRGGARGAALVRADRRLRTEVIDSVRAGLHAIGELEAVASMGAFVDSVDWTFPELLEDDEFLIEVDGLVHPFLDEAVRNPLRLGGGEPMVFLTGPNMAGKTTYLRAVGLMVVLAQAGLPVPAERARLTPVEAVFTSLNPSDNLRAGLSYFLAEVHRVRAAAELLVSGRRALVLFDEVFKGTNVKDALEASAQVIAGFAKASGSGFIFSSHLAELAEALGSDSRIRFAYFDGEIVEGRPMYSYRLHEGVSDKRFGLVLLRNARIPELIARLGS